MAVNDLFTVEMRYLSDAREMSSVFAYRATFGEAVVPMSRSLDRAFNADIIPEVLATWTTEVQLMSTYVLGINPAGRIPSYTYQTADFGTIVDDTYPNNRTYVIKQITNAPNSKHNGRIYMSGFGHGNVTAQILNAAYLDGVVQDLIDVLVADIVDPDEASRIWRPVVVNRVVLGVPVVPPGFFDVEALTANATIFSQRRRTTPRTNAPA